MRYFISSYHYYHRKSGKRRFGVFFIPGLTPGVLRSLYKICTRALWDETVQTGVFPGMPVDVRDGYIHFSTAEQQEETARKYFAGQTGLMLLTIDAELLGDHLRWEALSSGNRSGLFPHLYGELTLADVIEAVPFSVD